MAEQHWIHSVKLTAPYTTTSVNPAAFPHRFQVTFVFIYSHSRHNCEVFA